MRDIVTGKKKTTNREATWLKSIEIGLGEGVLFGYNPSIPFLLDLLPMHPLDEKLEELVLQAQQCPRCATTRRQKILQELWDTMLPSKHRPPKPTDDEARRRLEGLKKSAGDRYGNQLSGDFNQDWPDVLQEAQTEVLTKIDIYKKGVDSELYNIWYVLSEIQFLKTNLNFRNPKFIKHQKQLCIRFKKVKIQSVNCEDCCNQNANNNADLLEVWDACFNDIKEKLPEEVAKFSRRFEQRRTKKVSAQTVMIFAFHLLLQSGSYKITLLLMHDYPKNKNGMIVVKPYPQEKAQRLSQIRENFCNRIQTNEVDLQQAWNTFCNEVQQLYQPFKFWNWLASYIKFRFFDIIRERVKEVSLDAPGRKQEENDQPQTKLDKIQAKADSKLSPQAIKLIYEDPDEIFRGKHIKIFPNVNFREIALLKFQEFSLEEINQHFGNQVNAQTTISPFYTRSCYYFKPILEEYLEARIALPQPVIEQIVNDIEGRYNKRRMPGNSQISFQEIIQSRLGGVPSWKILAQIGRAHV